MPHARGYDEEMIFARSICAVLLAMACAVTMRAATIPAAEGTALDGHAVSLPRDLSQHATVLILGFTRQSQDATTTWQKAVQTQLTASGVEYFDMPFLEDAPGFVRPMIVRSIRKQIPEALRSRFLPLTKGQAAWKHAVSYTQTAPDAAYVLVVDRRGTILWQTHEAYSPMLFEQMAHKAKSINAPHN